MRDRSSALARLEAASQGFRARYLTYEELTRQVRAWAEAFPELCRLETLGATPEGRALWLLTLGPEPERVRPAAWLDGNMHASELAGSSVALAIAEDVLRVHLGAPAGTLPAHVLELLRSGVLFHVLPRMCPDGAERVLTTGAYVRSNPRDGRLGRTAPHWRAADIDGDGQARLLRRVDPAGDFVASPDEPRLMLPRRLEDPGPYYAVYPEGFVENWDGFTVPPAADFFADNETDLNRNFPYQWAPEPRQPGAGAFATSEPESRAVTAFASAHPNLFAWLNLHTFGGCYIRPAHDVTDKRMNPHDLALFRQLEEWTDAFTGYPMVSGFEEFCYEPDKPLCGDLTSFAYAQRGAVAFVCELWDFHKQAGLAVRRPFVDNFLRRTRADCVAMARWDREHNQGRMLGAFRPFDHPQLGPVEVGGFDPRFGIWNPPPERLAEVCAQQAEVFLRLAALAPRLGWTSVEVERLGPGLTEVRAVVENTGYLPTYVLDSARALSWNDPVRARALPGDGLTLAAGPEERLVGHLGGWGGFERPSTPIFARTGGEPTRRKLAWVVRGKGRLVLRAGCARTGQVETNVDVA